MNEIQFDATPFFLFIVGMLVVYSIGTLAVYWKLFVLAKKPGWAILLPFYSAYIIGQIAKKPKIALRENILTTGFVLALIISSLSASIEMKAASLLVALLIFIAWLVNDIKLEKYFLKQFTPSILVNQIKFNLNPFSTLRKLSGVKYKNK